MKLRSRLVLTTALVMVPVAALFVWAEGEGRQRAARDALAADALALLDEGARAQCDASPEAWTRTAQGGHAGPEQRPSNDGPLPHRPPEPSGRALRVHLFPYDASFAPSVVGAPTLGDDLTRSLRDGATRSPRHVDGAGGGNEQMLIRAPWTTGRCAYFLAIRPAVAPRVDLLASVRSLAPSLAAVILAIFLTVGPLVRRIRALAASVRASATHRYRDRITVTGNDEISALAEAFDAAAREVREHVDAQERREQTLRDFLANTTHDVMTPLTVLQGHLATLRDAMNDGGVVDRATLDAAIGETSYIGSLLNNLGVAARLEAGEPHFMRTTVDIARLVERCVTRHRPVARQHGVEVEPSVPETSLTVEGDETFLEQAVSNVVFNAIRHNPSGGHVAVLVTLLDERRFRVRVIDDGPGLSDEELARLSDPTSTIARARTRRRDGHGLGLAIARRVCDLHGMTLTFARAESGGLCVDLEGTR